MKTVIYPFKDKLAYNCVFWVRNRIPNLPYGLFTLWNKKRIIDTQNPKKGRVAIIETNQRWGHVAIVKEVEKDLVTIEEANFYKNKISLRKGTEKELNIIGYFNPNKKRWQKGR